MKRKYDKSIYIHLILLLINLFIIIDTNNSRGYFAIGGEWLVYPLFLLIDFMSKNIWNDIR